MSVHIGSLWQSMPWEIQSKIIQNVIDEEHAVAKTVAPYATVSKSWQKIAEKVTFRELNIAYNDLPSFEAAFDSVRSRRRYVEHIGLEIKFISLETFDDGEWDEDQLIRNLKRLSREVSIYQPTSDDAAVWEKVANDALVTKTIYEFLGCMSCWEKAETRHHGICLELVTRNRGFCQKLADRMLDHEAERFLKYDLEDPLSDPTSPSIYSQVRAFLCHSAARDFDRQADWDQAQLPLGFECASTDVITGVLIRADNPRYISPDVVTRLVARLPSARSIDWQFKPRFCKYEQHDRLVNDQIKAFKQLPATVKQLCLHQFGESQTWGFLGRTAYDSQKCVKLATQLRALATSQLETLSLTGIVDGQHLFKLAGKTPWPTLKRLTLTTSCMNDEPTLSFEDSRPQQLASIIQRAGKAALVMPQLDYLSLTNSDFTSRTTYFFSFEVSATRPRAFQPAQAVVTICADKDNRHMTDEDDGGPPCLRQWEELAARRCLQLVYTVGYGEPERYAGSAMLDSLSSHGRWQAPMEPPRAQCSRSLVEGLLNTNIQISEESNGPSESGTEPIDPDL